MKKKIYLIYLLHTSGRELIGIATTPQKRDRLIRSYLRTCSYEKLSLRTVDTAIDEIQKLGRTQSLYKDFGHNIETEEYYPNVIL